MSEARLPTVDELLPVSRRALGAFAARCARRVLPLLKASWTTATDEDVRRVTEAVVFAEQASAGLSVGGSPYQVGARYWIAAENVSVRARASSPIAGRSLKPHSMQLTPLKPPMR